MESERTSEFLAGEAGQGAEEGGAGGEETGQRKLVVSSRRTGMTAGKGGGTTQHQQRRRQRQCRRQQRRRRRRPPLRSKKHTSEAPDKQTNRPTTPNDDGATRYCSPTTMIINDPVQKWVDCLDVGHDAGGRAALARGAVFVLARRRNKKTKTKNKQKNKKNKQPACRWSVCER